jgi:hypothetical protein
MRLFKSWVISRRTVPNPRDSAESKTTSKEHWGLEEPAKNFSRSAGLTALILHQGLSRRGCFPWQQARTVDPDAASETIAALQVKLLRLDFDLSHARAVKAVFDDQVQYLMQVLSNSTEEVRQSALPSYQEAFSRRSIAAPRLAFQNGAHEQFLLPIIVFDLHANVRGKCDRLANVCVL